MTTSGAVADKAAVKVACTGTLHERTYTHSLSAEPARETHSFCRRRLHVQVPCARAFREHARERIHADALRARARQFTKNARIHSLLGGVALELLDY